MQYFISFNCNSGCTKALQYYVIYSLPLLLDVVLVWRWDLLWDNCNSLSFLIGSFAILRKASISFVMSVCPSFPMEHLGSHRMDFHEFWNVSIFRTSVQSIETSLKSHNINVYFTWSPNTYLVKRNRFVQHSSSFVRLLTALNSPLSTSTKPATDTTGGYVTIVSRNIFTCKQNQLRIKLKFFVNNLESRSNS
jgi:hypothetical protein